NEAFELQVLNESNRHVLEV
ncbi:unnamed protein product, partial [Adineta steineri]